MRRRTRRGSTRTRPISSRRLRRTERPEKVFEVPARRGWQTMFTCSMELVALCSRTINSRFAIARWVIGVFSKKSERRIINIPDWCRTSQPNINRNV